MIDRRDFLHRVGRATAFVAAAPWLRAQPRAGAFAIRREVFLPSPAKGVTVLASSRYTRRDGVELCARHSHMSRSDTADRIFVRYSDDNGRSWSETNEIPTVQRRGDATFRRSATGSLVDPRSGALVELRNEGVFADDTPLGRLRGWTISYAVSEDGGRSWAVAEPVIHRGAGFSAEHPLPGVWHGKNCAYIGDMGSAPLALGDGTILAPMQVVPLGDDGKFHNPTGGYTYTHAAVLRGRWAGGQAKKIEWEMSAVVRGDPAISTRGMIEPTIAELADGRLLMVLRGSNEKKPSLFAGKWAAFSTDGGRTWSEPRAWTFADGQRFHSPSACSQLLAHSSGRLFWLGNITPANPNGNRPRYPFVIGEVDRRTGLLRRETLTTIDDRGAGDGELLALSNFLAREDRSSGEIVLHMSRQGAKSVGTRHDFTADAFVYRIALTP